MAPDNCGHGITWKSLLKDGSEVHWFSFFNSSRNSSRRAVIVPLFTAANVLRDSIESDCVVRLDLFVLSARLNVIMAHWQLVKLASARPVFNIACWKHWRLVWCDMLPAALANVSLISDLSCYLSMRIIVSRFMACLRGTYSFQKSPVKHLFCCIDIKSCVPLLFLALKLFSQRNMVCVYILRTDDIKVNASIEPIVQYASMYVGLNFIKCSSFSKHQSRLLIYVDRNVRLYCMEVNW